MQAEQGEEGLGRGTVTLALAGLALVAAASITFVWPGGDARFALLWGDELVRGETPDFDSAVPAKHPLTLALGTIFTVAGTTGARAAISAVSLLSLALLLFVTYRLGVMVGGRRVGALAIILVLLIPEVLRQAASSGKDLPFAALTLTAVMLAIDDRERSWPKIMGLLAVAGLIRPEAWALAGLYGGYLLLARAGPPRIATVALVLVAPLIWLSVDLTMTGDPLHTINHSGEKQKLKREEADAPTTFVNRDKVPAIERLGIALERGIPGQIGWPVTVAALLIAIATLARRRPDSRSRHADPDAPGLPSEPVVIMLAIVVAGILFAALLALATLPLAARFLLVPAIALLVVAAASLSLVRRGAVPAIALILVLVGAGLSLPSTISELDSTYDAYAIEANRSDDLVELVLDPAVRDALRECPDLVFAGRPRRAIKSGRVIVAAELDIPPREMPFGEKPLLEDSGDSAIAYRIEADKAGVYSGGAPKTPPPTAIERGEWLFASLCGETQDLATAPSELP